MAPITGDKSQAGKRVAARLAEVIRADRIMTDALMTYAYSGDASSYRLVPVVVVIGDVATTSVPWALIACEVTSELPATALK